MTLTAQNQNGNNPLIPEPRERAASGATSVAAGAVLAWVLYGTFFLNGIPLAGLILGIAVATTVSAVITACWYHLAKLIAHISTVVLGKIAALETKIQRLAKLHGDANTQANTALLDRLSTLEDKINHLSEDHGRIVANLQAARVEARRDHVRRLELLADEDDDNPLASVTSLHGASN